MKRRTGRSGRWAKRLKLAASTVRAIWKALIRRCPPLPRPWFHPDRTRLRAEGKAPTQILAERLFADGYAGLLVRSFAKGATGGDLNMALWVWGSSLPTKLVLIDDEGRLLQLRKMVGPHDQCSISASPSPLNAAFIAGSNPGSTRAGP